MDLPKEFKERMKKILGDEEALRAFLASFEAAPVRSLRVNTLKTDNDEFETLCDFPYSRLPFAENGYVFECDRIGSQPIHHAGGVYVQEPAAMAALECTDIFPGMKVLDVCASPGGKSTQAASKLGGDGVIVSNEIDAQRCNVLAQNIERIGVRNAEITNTDSASLAEAFPDYFDLVIVDAPCSGEGMM
ncbi:MAG: RsmB/NOP family class I SAM-dependent RNA methyltransferase, partial [Clostridia bacterium]|nr:RsmB/NOP family class I SAM-dependent RNA methyltransferase [Clostridia bacterium]